jgi:hypothetical protein
MQLRLRRSSPTLELDYQHPRTHGHVGREGSGGRCRHSALLLLRTSYPTSLSVADGGGRPGSAFESAEVKTAAAELRTIVAGKRARVNGQTWNGFLARLAETQEPNISALQTGCTETPRLATGSVQCLSQMMVYAVRCRPRGVTAVDDQLGHHHRAQIAHVVHYHPGALICTARHGRWTDVNRG